MELSAPQMVLANGGGHCPAIAGARSSRLAVITSITVREIDVVTNVEAHPIGPINARPPHVRDGLAGSAFQGAHAAGEQAEQRRRTLLRGFEEHLHTKTDAQQGFRARR